MKKFLIPVLAFFSGIIVITLVLIFSSETPTVSIAAFFTRPFSSWWNAGNLLNKAGLLMLAASGAAFALKSGAFNLGGEAQIYAPALVTAVILSSPTAQAAQGAVLWCYFLQALILAVLTGAIIGGIPGILRTKFQINELLTSFLLSAAIVPVIDYLISGPLRDSKKNLLATRAIAEAFKLPPFLRPALLNISFPIAIICALIAWLFISKTRAGYKISISGIAPEFALFAGFPVNKTAGIGMIISGSLHGLAGFFAVTGTWYLCHNGGTAGMGWSALAIALIARGNLLAVIPSALLYAWLETASETAVLATRFSFDSTSLIQGVIFLVVSARGLKKMNIFTARTRRKTTEKTTKFSAQEHS